MANAYYNASHSQAAYVKRGFGQVEPNHLSAQHTGQIYAQLPAAKGIEILENGQFVKYDYANEVCDFTGEGEWMLVFNEVKVYRDFLGDADFAMMSDNYDARVYSPKYDEKDFQTRFLGGKNGDEEIRKVTTGEDPYEFFDTEDPFHTPIHTSNPKLMPEGTVMVPRVMKLNVGDIFTTNTIDEKELAVSDIVAPRAATGILAKDGDTSAMKLQVVKVYTMPDGQPGVKLMRIA